MPSTQTEAASEPKCGCFQWQQRTYSATFAHLPTCPSREPSPEATIKESPQPDVEKALAWADAEMLIMSHEHGHSIKRKNAARALKALHQALKAAEKRAEKAETATGNINVRFHEMDRELSNARKTSGEWLRQLLIMEGDLKEANKECASQAKALAEKDQEIKRLEDLVVGRLTYADHTKWAIDLWDAARVIHAKRKAAPDA